MFQHVRVRGDAHARGVMYGRQAARQIRKSIQAYAELFEHYAGWGWDAVLQNATRFVDPIKDFDPRFIEEMRGLAEGAEVTFGDILAINVRTEVMFAAKARAATATLPRVGECTSFAIVPPPASENPILVGQNWDWMLHASDTVVVLEADQEEGPNFVTVVEAGLLAKTGFNARGIAIATNALVSSRDKGDPGVPYHVLLRAMLDATTPTEALAALQRSSRSSSGAYVIGHREGLALTVEAVPGDFSTLFRIAPDERGMLLHGNHFEHPAIPASDVGAWLMPDSIFRLQRARALMRQVPAPISAKSMLEVLADHAGEPTSICCHPDGAAHPLDRSATIAAVVMDPAAGSMTVTHGAPCSGAPQELDYSSFFGTS